METIDYMRHRLCCATQDVVNKMDFTKISVVFVILILTLPSTITQATPHNSTFETQYHIDLLRGDQKKFEIDLLSDNETFDGAQEESYNVQTYNMTNCKAVLKDNVKGRFNLSAHHLVCKLLVH